MHAINALCPSGSPLLHLATASRSVRLLQASRVLSGQREHCIAPSTWTAACQAVDFLQSVLTLSWLPSVGYHPYFAAPTTCSRNLADGSCCSFANHTQVLAAWGRQQGFTWPIAAPAGPSALTPLHLAAAARDGPLFKALFGEPQLVLYAFLCLSLLLARG